IDVHDGNAARPSSHSFDACFDGYILEPEAAFVEIKSAGYPIAREEDILEAVIVKVADPHTAPVIDVDDVHRVEGIVFRDGIIKGDPCVGGRQFLEQLRFAAVAGRQPTQGYTKKYRPGAHRLNNLGSASGWGSGPLPPVVSAARSRLGLNSY